MSRWERQHCKLTPLAAFACRALIRLFSSAPDRLYHADPKSGAGVHFLVGLTAGIEPPVRMIVGSPGVVREAFVGEVETAVEEMESSHRSVLISLMRLPALFPVDGVFDVLAFGAGLAARIDCAAELVAEAVARFSAARPAGVGGALVVAFEATGAVVGVVLHVWAFGKRWAGQNWPLHVWRSLAFIS